MQNVNCDLLVCVTLFQRISPKTLVFSKANEITHKYGTMKDSVLEICI